MCTSSSFLDVPCLVKGILDQRRTLVKREQEGLTNSICITDTDPTISQSGKDWELMCYIGQREYEQTKLDICRRDEPVPPRQSTSGNWNIQSEHIPVTLFFCLVVTIGRHETRRRGGVDGVLIEEKSSFVTSTTCKLPGAKGLPTVCDTIFHYSKINSHVRSLVGRSRYVD